MVALDRNRPPDHRFPITDPQSFPSASSAPLREQLALDSRHLVPRLQPSGLTALPSREAVPPCQGYACGVV